MRLLTSGAPQARPLYLVVCIVVASLAGCKGRDSRTESASKSGGPRVVTLTPSSTEAVAAAAGVDVIVGVDEYSDRPEAVRDLPDVGSFLSPNQEAILRLEPDLVVLDAVQSKVVDGLEAAGVRTLSLRMERVEDVAAALVAIGEALGTQPRAEAAAANLLAELETVRVRVATQLADTPRPRVLLIVDRQVGGLGNMTAAGPGTFLSQLVDLAGGENALDHSPVSFPRISVEEVIRLAPEVIIDGVHTDSVTRATQDWAVLSSVPAVTNHRVHILGDPSFMHPNPRLASTLAALAALIHPGDGVDNVDNVHKPAAPPSGSPDTAP